MPNLVKLLLAYIFANILRMTKLLSFTAKIYFSLSLAVIVDNLAFGCSIDWTQQV